MGDPMEFTPILEGRTMFYVDELADESMPCDASLEGWAAWMAAGCKWAPGHTPDPPEDGAVFTVSSMVMQGDVFACWDGSGFVADSEPPAGADFFAPRFGPGLGWDAEFIQDTLQGVLDAEAELVAGSAEGDVDPLLIAVAIHQPQRRFRFERRPDGPRLVPVENVQ